MSEQVEFIFPTGNMLVSAKHPATGITVLMPAKTKAEAQKRIELAFKILDATEGIIHGRKALVQDNYFLSLGSMGEDL